MADTDLFLLDRSRLEAYQRCPRKYFWAYAYKGLGVSPRKRAIPLAFGGATHLGLEVLLRSSGDIEKAIESATNEFHLQTSTAGLDLQAGEDALQVYNEHRALLEGLLRVWYLYRYPSFIREYELLDIEREELWRISGGIGFMARADGVLRGRHDGSLYVLSFKTAKAWDKKRDDEARSDIQGISELVALEDRLGERVAGIQMEYLIKGSRNEYPKGSGIYSVYNPLIHPWYNQGTGRYAHSWDWRDQDGGHTLGNKFRRVDIWNLMSMVSWVRHLESGAVQPEAGNPLEKLCISPMPYMRNRDEIESWKVQAQSQALDMLDKGVRVERSRHEFSTALDNEFPQFRHSCNYPTACPFKQICFGSAGPEPENDPRYVWREPHHQLEVEQHAEREQHEAEQRDAEATQALA